MLLMSGSSSDLLAKDVDMLRAIGKKLGRLYRTLGLMGVVLAKLQESL